MLVLIDFYADWCGPCHAMKPILESVIKDYKDKIELKKVDIEADPSEAQKYGIMSIPTLVLVKDDVEVDRKVGLSSEEDLKLWLEKNYENSN